MPLPKMPSLSVRPSWPIPLPRLSWPALLLSLAGCATSSLDLAPPRADRPWTPPVDASGIVSGPARPDSPDARYVLPANAAAGAVPQDNAIDPGHEYTLAELIDLAQSSNPRTRIAWNAARNAALATGMVKSVYLPQLAATAMTGWRHSNGSSNIGLGDSSSNSSTHGTVGVLSLQWLLFDFGGRQARAGRRTGDHRRQRRPDRRAPAAGPGGQRRLPRLYRGARAPSTRGRAWSMPAPCSMLPTRATGKARAPWSRWRRRPRTANRPGWPLSPPTEPNRTLIWR